MVNTQFFASFMAVVLMANSCQGIGLLQGLGLYRGSPYFGNGFNCETGLCGGLGGYGRYGLNTGCGLGCGLGAYGGLGGYRGLSNFGCGTAALDCGLKGGLSILGKCGNCFGCGLPGLPPSGCCLDCLKPCLKRKLCYLKQKLLAKKLAGFFAGGNGFL